MAAAPKPPTAVEQLEELVAAMRRLGVLEYNGIKLGAPPGPAPKQETREEMEKRLEREKEHRNNIMFAATSVRPRGI